MPGRAPQRSVGRAFTIIELLIVLALAAVLIALVWPTFALRGTWGIREAEARVATGAAMARATSDANGEIIELWAEETVPVRLVLRRAATEEGPTPDEQGRVPRERVVAELPVGVRVVRGSKAIEGTDMEETPAADGLRLIVCRPGGVCEATGAWRITDGQREFVPRVNVWTGAVEFESVLDAADATGPVEAEGAPTGSDE